MRKLIPLVFVFGFSSVVHAAQYSETIVIPAGTLFDRMHVDSAKAQYVDKYGPCDGKWVRNDRGDWTWIEADKNKNTGAAKLKDTVFGFNIVDGQLCLPTEGKFSSGIETSQTEGVTFGMKGKWGALSVENGDNTTTTVVLKATPDSNKKDVYLLFAEVSVTTGDHTNITLGAGEVSLTYQTRTTNKSSATLLLGAIETQSMQYDEYVSSPLNASHPEAQTSVFLTDPNGTTLVHRVTPPNGTSENEILAAARHDSAVCLDFKDCDDADKDARIQGTDRVKRNTPAPVAGGYGDYDNNGYAENMDALYAALWEMEYWAFQQEVQNLWLDEIIEYGTYEYIC